MSELSDLLERFRRGAELVAVATTGASNVELDFAPGPDRWTSRQIVCHLADAELVGGDRFRRTIAEDNPVIVNYDEKAWAAKLGYEKRRITDVLASFRTIRSDNYELLKGQPEEAFARTCRHSERGPLTLKELLVIYVEHAEKHAQQIMAARRKYKESKAAAR